MFNDYQLFLKKCAVGLIAVLVTSIVIAGGINKLRTGSFLKFNLPPQQKADSKIIKLNEKIKRPQDSVRNEATKEVTAKKTTVAKETELPEVNPKGNIAEVILEEEILSDTAPQEEALPEKTPEEGLPKATEEKVELSKVSTEFKKPQKRVRRLSRADRQAILEGQAWLKNQK